MKKQFLTLLCSALFASSMVHNMHAGPIKKTASGSWQVVKIGIGIALMVGGVVVAVIPCTDNKCFDEFVKECGGACRLAGIIPAAPITICGALMIKSGIKKLNKIMDGKKHKHTAHSNVSVVVNEQSN